MGGSDGGGIVGADVNDHLREGLHSPPGSVPDVEGSGSLSKGR